jgi:hypothetical protein
MRHPTAEALARRRCIIGRERRILAQVFGPRQDRFEQWLHAPAIPETCADRRFALRKLLPSEFGAVYDLVDEAFGAKRPRRVYDWIYRDNPNGVARCWGVFDTQSGRLVWSHAGWPWPAARGEAPLVGGLIGDVATAPAVQRQGVIPVLRSNLISHPDCEREVLLGWPNARSVQWFRKRQQTHRLAGPMPRAVLHLRGRARLARSGRPASVAAALRRLLARAADASLRIEEVDRFDASFDAATRRHAGCEDLWFPHDAEHLNWRYRRHPLREHRARALVRGEAVEGYCVLRTESRRALLVEFVAPEAPRGPREMLLAAAVEAARDADCDRIETFASPRWRHWPFLREAGFVERESEYYVFLRQRFSPQSRLEEWQILPGDHDGV